MDSKTIFENIEMYNLQRCGLECLLDHIKKCGGAIYITSYSAKNFVDKNELKKNSVDITFKDYGLYPKYPQLFPPFEHFVSIDDVFFNTGQAAPYCICGRKEGQSVN